MSKTPVVTSADVNVRVAFHLSNLPAIATEALTENATELSSCVITTVGACARHGGVSTADATRPKIAIRIVTECDLFSHPLSNEGSAIKPVFRGELGRPWLPRCDLRNS